MGTIAAYIPNFIVIENGKETVKKEVPMLLLSVRPTNMMINLCDPESSSEHESNSAALCTVADNFYINFQIVDLMTYLILVN